jgi:hypothetical protein
MKYEDRFASPEARRVYEGILRRMSPEQKLDAVARARRRIEELALAGVKLDHPDWTLQQQRAETRKRLTTWNS